MFKPDSSVEQSLLWRSLSYSCLILNRDISIPGSHSEFLHHTVVLFLLSSPNPLLKANLAWKRGLTQPRPVFFCCPHTTQILSVGSDHTYLAPTTSEVLVNLNVAAFSQFYYQSNQPFFDIPEEVSLPFTVYCSLRPELDTSPLYLSITKTIFQNLQGAPLRPPLLGQVLDGSITPQPSSQNTHHSLVGRVGDPQTSNNSPERNFFNFFSPTPIHLFG